MITAYNPRRMPLVTLTTFRNAHDAQLAKAVLADEGVPAFLGDENVTSIAPYTSPMGVKLQVASEDAERECAAAERSSSPAVRVRAFNNRGLAYHELNQLVAAEASYRSAIRSNARSAVRRTSAARGVWLAF